MCILHGMLVGRKATQVENGAEEEWEMSIGPQVQEVESTVNACVMQLKFGDQWKFFTRGGGQPTHFGVPYVMHDKRGDGSKTVHAIKNGMEKKKRV